MRAKLISSLAVVWAVSSFTGASMAQTKPKRISVAVMDFDYGTVGYHWWGEYDIGKGMADQIVDELVNDPASTFRVIERKKLDTVLAEQDFSRSDRAAPSAAKLSKVGKVLGVQYIISGSITKFGGEEKNYGGSAPVAGRFGGLGIKKVKTEVALTARLIDTTSGEIMMSAKGLGVSNKGGGLSVSRGGVGSFNMGSSDYKSSAIGEAQEKACTELVKQILLRKDKLE